MADYTYIKGQKVQVLTTDPTDLVRGQIWYNSTDKVFKGTVYQYGSSGAWSSGGSLNTARQRLAGAGTQTTGLAFAGTDDTIKLGSTEEYDGSSWTSSGSIGDDRDSLAGAGTQTAGLAIGGYDGVLME